MKSLVLKDLLNIKKNSRQLLITLVFISVIYAISGILDGIIYMIALISSTFIMSTFVFDEASKWNRFALIMPVSRQKIIGAKYVCLAILSLFGTLFGFVMTMACKLVIDRTLSPSVITANLINGLIALCFVMTVVSTVIPFIVKFGSEKGRLYFFASLVIPLGLVFLTAWILKKAGVSLDERLVVILLCSMPVITLLWNFVSYKISLGIFERQDI